jgi:Raf kinase inhibitor-like YbhB/YbcL family protein
MVQIELTSGVFGQGDAIPARFTCDGNDISPPLRWGNTPRGTRSLVLICEDPDAPNGTWVHWLLYNLPATLSEIPEGVPATEILPTGAQQGINDFQQVGYRGPCPPPGKAHRYYFRLYALDTEAHPPTGPGKKELMAAMQGHTLGQGELMGTYQKRAG